MQTEPLPETSIKTFHAPLTLDFLAKLRARAPRGFKVVDNVVALGELGALCEIKQFVDKDRPSTDPAVDDEPLLYPSISDVGLLALKWTWTPALHPDGWLFTRDTFKILDKGHLNDDGSLDWNNGRYELRGEVRSDGTRVAAAVALKPPQ